MIRITLALVAAAALFASGAYAEAVTLENKDGTHWVMQIEPGVSRVPPVVPLPEIPADEVETVTAEKPVAAATDVGEMPPAPEPVIETSIVQSRGMMIIPRGAESCADLAVRYKQIYAAIPFNRAEYVANPSYRHDATMELLTGNVQPGGGKTGRVLRGREYTGYRPYIPAKYDYYRYRFPVGYGLYGFNRLPFAGYGYAF